MTVFNVSHALRLEDVERCWAEISSDKDRGRNIYSSSSLFLSSLSLDACSWNHQLMYLITLLGPHRLRKGPSYIREGVSCNCTSVATSAASLLGQPPAPATRTFGNVFIPLFLDAPKVYCNNKHVIQDLLYLQIRSLKLRSKRFGDIA